MKKTVHKKKNKKSLGKHWHIAFVFLSAFLFGFVVYGFKQGFFDSSKLTFAESMLICPTPEPGKKTLQLGTCYLATGTPPPTTMPSLPPSVPTRAPALPREIISIPPTPFPSPTRTITLTPAPQKPKGCGLGSGSKGRDGQGNCCMEDGPVNSPSECCPGVPYCDFHKPTGFTSGGGGGSGSCACSNGVCRGSSPDYPFWCDAKPIIYLYPEEKTIVDVVVTVPGTIPISDPLYPEGGWRNIEAHPDGTLIYQNQKYKELFYEAAITPIDPPKNGVIVRADQLITKLTEMTTQLGLRGYEQQDFLDYWVPKLKELKSQYLLVSVFSPEQKQIIDKVDISPKPDTFIEFIMYYKPLEKPVAVKPLQLPTTPPERKGFTAVEWGGIIDH